MSLFFSFLSTFLSFAVSVFSSSHFVVCFFSPVFHLSLLIHLRPVAVVREINMLVNVSCYYIISIKLKRPNTKSFTFLLLDSAALKQKIFHSTRNENVIFLASIIEGIPLAGGDNLYLYLVVWGATD